MADKPHILILMTDQQRGDCLGCDGHPVLRTPHMDRIAAEGVRFSNAVTPSPLCQPARACFISGLYCHNHGVWRNSGHLPANDETYFHHLQAAGYTTGYVGKSHLYDHSSSRHLADHEPYMHARGMDYVCETTGPWATTKAASYLTDEWGKEKWQAFKDDYARRRGTPWATWPSPLSEEDFPDSFVGRKAVEYIEGLSGDQPMCLFVGFGGPHEPFDAPEPYASMYNPADCPPAIPPESMEGLPEAAAGYIGFRESFLRGASEVDPSSVAAARANYYGKIALIDAWIGRIFAALEARGWMDDTLVVLWSDHGEMAGDHGMFYKRTFFEGSVRVPLLLRWPKGIPAGQVRPQLAETIDVFDTLLETAGCEPSARSFGRSLLPVARDSGIEHRDAAFSEVDWGGPIGRTTMIRTERHRYAVNAAGEPLMLFDLVDDPTESRNLLAELSSADLRADLDARIYRWMLETQTTT